MDDLISREEAIEILSEMRAEYNLFGDAEEATRYHVLTWAIREMKAAQQWIPASERLPEIDMGHPHHEDYLVQYDSGDMDVASWSNVNRFWTDRVTEPYWNCVQFAKVVAWMPLPEPWRGEE